MHELISLMRSVQRFMSRVVTSTMISIIITVTISTSIMLAEELGFTQRPTSRCQGSESMDVVDLHCLLPYFSQSLLYSETRSDKEPGAGPAMREIRVRSLGGEKRGSRRRGSKGKGGSLGGIGDSREPGAPSHSSVGLECPSQGNWSLKGQLRDHPK